MLVNRPTMESARRAAREAVLEDERAAVARLVARAALSDDARRAISRAAEATVAELRADAAPSLMESFLAEYGLTTREGVALMCLAEALLRVPDAETIDALIEDKIAPGDWGAHLGRASSSLVNASTWALLLTGRVLSEREQARADPITGALRSAVKRLGEPVIRVAVGRAMKELGGQFVFGRDIDEALARARPLEADGYGASYDMLGEAARTQRDAERYFEAYAGALDKVAAAASRADVRDNPGLSVKLSALHPRYERAQADRAVPALIEALRALARRAKAGGVGLNVDAEEADRLDLSLDVIAAAASDPELAGWDGFGVVVQAFGQRAPHVIDWLAALAAREDRRLMVRLVKGAYWDAEIKRAQTLGLDGFPVFTRKEHSDVSFIACARQLFAHGDRLYPQFATHNAHTMHAILAMAPSRDAFEFQRLHGMGERLHAVIKRRFGARCRIYAPVGAHRDLLAYLVRRLLENGANSSFVNQMVDDAVSPAEIAQDPFERVAAHGGAAHPAIARGPDLYGAARRNARGWDLTDPLALERLAAARAPFERHVWRFEDGRSGPLREIRNPARPGELVGVVREASAEDAARAAEAAVAAQPRWEALGAAGRAAALERAADLYETHAPELMALAAREAGKTWMDGVAELREAVDFLRYYAAEARRLEAAAPPRAARGLAVCISPWNFPLAIFTGQIAAALAAGNAALAKPAEQTPLIAARAVALMREAGVPAGALELTPGAGETVGAALTAEPRTALVAFTGSTETAQRIHAALARHAPAAALIAETGGLNAMVVDSTALAEQAVRDVVASAFQSAGQRCSAARMLYLQRDVADEMLEMLKGAMATLRVGDPWALETDVGPVIDAAAQADVAAHCARLASEGRELATLPAPAEGVFAPPALFAAPGIGALEREVFGPALHVATFEAGELDGVIDAVNATGYGLTFGLHTRIDDRVQAVVDRIRAGNVYVNRNQIGAIVGSQPFGGEGLSGTGPKAGGPLYLRRFGVESAPAAAPAPPAAAGPGVDAAALAAALDAPALSEAALAAWAARDDRAARLEEALGAAQGGALARAALAATAALDLGPLELPGPTGESNRWRALARGRALCLGPGPELLLAQALQALAPGGGALLLGTGARAAAAALAAAGAPALGIEGALAPEALETAAIDLAAAQGDASALAALRQALAARTGPILPLVADAIAPEAYLLERAVSIDTTAAGGDAALLAAAAREGGAPRA